MALAIFDLDNTLLAGDSDHAWGEFLIEQGLADAVEHRRRNDAFYADYQRGALDIEAYVAFALGPVMEMPTEQLAALHRRFMASHIAPMRLTAAEQLLALHRTRGDTLMIITATNSVVTGPIAAALEVPILLATDPEWREGRLTGRIAGTPCFQGGKVTRLQQWLVENPGHDLTGSWFYSDSHNDLPLLEVVEHPVAVDPDPRLAAEAEARGWRIISLR